MDDQFITTGDGRGDVGSRKTHFYSKKVYFIIDRNDGNFGPSQHHHIKPPMYSPLSMGYSDNATGYSSIFIASGNDKGGVGPRTTQLSSHSDDCDLMVVICVILE